MRIYVAILGTALLAIALLLLLGWLYLKSFFYSGQFIQSLYVEALSFVFTTALIGSVSAAVLRYIDRRRAEPILAYARSNIAYPLADFADEFEALLAPAHTPKISYSSSYASGERLLREYQTYEIADTIERCGRCIREIHRTCAAAERFGHYFAIEFQDDLFMLTDRLKAVEVDLRFTRACLDRSDAAKDRDLLPEELRAPAFNERWGFRMGNEAPPASGHAADIHAAARDLLGAKWEKTPRKRGGFDEPFSHAFRKLTSAAASSDIKCLLTRIQLTDGAAGEPQPHMYNLVVAVHRHKIPLSAGFVTDEKARLVARLPSRTIGDAVESIYSASNAELTHIRRHLKPWVEEMDRSFVDKSVNGEIEREPTDSRHWRAQWHPYRIDLPRFDAALAKIVSPVVDATSISNLLVLDHDENVDMVVLAFRHEEAAKELRKHIHEATGRSMASI